ncbi:MAG: MBL fold metallo-hydrolase [Deltaproteobacteria bacterium]|nr:MAG: MBL fold metallo-hydrolase [Deltaproteobacteria bacterium]
MRRLTSILGNAQRLDGGAMFGNAPKALWTRWIQPDDQNRIPLCCRCLLVQEEGRNLLFETGIGCFFEPKFKDRYGVVEDGHVLLENLATVGLSHEDIDVVVLSHLHFDHAGGLLTAFDPQRPPELLFPRATFVVGDRAWARANAPHFRDRASFIQDIQRLLQASGRLHLTEGPTCEVLGEGYRFHLSEGHTPGLLLTEIDVQGTPVVFAGDLIPGAPWVHLPITMGYDRYPERLIDEKAALLTDLLDRGGRLFFTHDHQVALAGLARDDRGRFRAVEPLEHLAGWEA